MITTPEVTKAGKTVNLGPGNKVRYGIGSSPGSPSTAGLAKTVSIPGVRKPSAGGAEPAVFLR